MAQSFWPLIAEAGLSYLGSQTKVNGVYSAATAQNKAILEANDKNYRNTMYTLGYMRVQQAQRMHMLSQNKADLSVSQQEELAKATANAAAAGNVGASVDAVRNDVLMQYGRARAALGEQVVQEQFNFNTQVEGLLRNALDSSNGPVEAKVPSQSSRLLGALTSASSMYLQSYLSLGLGAGSDAPATGTDYTAMTRSYNW